MEQLIQRCQQGDKVAMGQLYTVMHDELLAHCRKYVANDNMAEDLLHDAFLLIFSNINKVRSPEKGLRWMHKVVRNVCLLYVWHQKNRTLVSVDEVRETSQTVEPDMTLTYDEIMSAINQLPRGYRQVFRLSVLEGLTHQQIAELLGIEPHTSSSQLLRAKKQLRQLLQVLMLVLLAAVPFGGYYYWLLQNRQHDVAEMPENTPIGTKEVAKEDYKDENVKRTASLPTVSVSDTTICLSKTDVEEKVKAGEREEVDAVAENDRMELNHEEVPEKVPTPPTPSIKQPSLCLSLAYSGLPDVSARQLPFGAEGMNGNIDSVTHHRMPISVALNACYRIGSHWWLDGGLRYSQLSSETRVGNTYLYKEQQQHVHYLGLSFGAGRQLWQSHHWSLYANISLLFEFPLRSTVETTYWMGSQLIDQEIDRIVPPTQWSVGIGVGLQYNVTPTVGFFTEPSLRYYFHHSNNISTWYTEHPFTPHLPLGIRIMF
jgi:RNA polymerase sigma-70 factor (ECF subfamily)